MFSYLQNIMKKIYMLIFSYNQKKNNSQININNSTDIKYDTKGTHIFVDLWNLDVPNFESFNKFIYDSAPKHRITIIKSVHHMFNEIDDNSYTALYLLAESHLSIHTYPEHSYASLDIYTCGSTDTKQFMDEAIKFLYRSTKINAKSYILNNTIRGVKRHY